MEEKLKSIEVNAYKMAGREFCMSSPQEVSKVLYEEMAIPFPGTPVKYFIFVAAIIISLSHYLFF